MEAVNEVLGMRISNILATDCLAVLELNATRTQYLEYSVRSRKSY